MYATKENTHNLNSGKNNAAKAKATKGQPSQMMVHAKLEMTAPSDYEESEADHMADAIVGGGKISRAIEGNASNGGTEVPKGMEAQLQQCQGGGRAMPEGLRSMMESGFGRDFSQVRIHTDNQAAEMSRAINARAFTHGYNIYFNHGQFSPDTHAGQHLIAHELTHVAQGGAKVARKGNEETQTVPNIIDEGQVAWSRSLSKGLYGFNADNLAMITLIKSLRPKVERLLGLRSAILKVANPTTAEELGLPDISHKDLDDIDEARVSCFNDVKEAIENSKQEKANAKRVLKDVVSEFQTMAETLTLLSDCYDDAIKNMVQLKTDVENDLRRTITRLRYEVGDRRSLIYTKYEKVVYGHQLLVEAKDKAIFYVRWTAAPSDSELESVNSAIKGVRGKVEHIYDLRDDYIARANSISESEEIPFESFNDLSNWAKNFNDEVESAAKTIYQIDCRISDLRDESISSAENWVTGLKITSEVCITVASSFLPGAALAKAGSLAVKGVKLAKVGNAINKITNSGKITKIVAKTVTDTALNVASTGIEHGMKKIVNATTGTDVFKLPDGKDYAKSAIAGSFSSATSGILKAGTEIASTSNKVGIFGKAFGKLMTKEGKFKNISVSVEDAVDAAAGYGGDLLSKAIVDGKVSYSAWDLANLLGVVKIKTSKTTADADELKKAEDLLADVRGRRGDQYETLQAYKRKYIEQVDKQLEDELNNLNYYYEEVKKRIDRQFPVKEGDMYSKRMQELDNLFNNRRDELKKLYEIKKTELEEHCEELCNGIMEAVEPFAYRRYVEAKHNVENFGIGKNIFFRDDEIQNGQGLAVKDNLPSTVLTKLLGNQTFQNMFNEKDTGDTLKFKYERMNDEFRTGEKYEDRRTEKHYIFFPSGSAEINRLEDVDIIANSVLGKKMMGNANINIRIIGQASPRWQEKKSNEHGMELNEKLAQKRLESVREALFNKLLERNINYNEIGSGIMIEEMTRTANLTLENERENNANLADRRNVIVEITCNYHSM